ncbi:hypothetical protein Riv7116_5448 [Rivularia sp. PCC 7116]|uniref:hypothetical protein n=1 Tax=Rivularia sp. PCC 7116 TaxID=373994 RepID=UPI00029F4327|nr:hypothetical protein [Rivularia sp. PCC 7116]AFY57824.1 hypothetical protein Riv7116_5448 [Rivularia sp. PCC 7116]
MKNKVAAIVTGAMLTLTAGILPSYALNTNNSSVSTTGTNLKTVNLDNAFNQTSNGKLLIAQRRRRRVIRRKGRIIRRRVRVCRTIRK